MNLKSKMTLDIGNVTKNLGKVASSTKGLAKQLSNAFSGAAQDVHNLDAQITNVAKMEGLSKSKVIGELLSAPIASLKDKLVDNVKTAFSGISETMRALKQDMAMDGTLNTLTTHMASFGASSKNALVYVMTLANTLKGKVVNAATSVTDAFKRLSVGVMKPLALAAEKVSNAFSKMAATIGGVLYTGNKTAEDLLETTKKTGVQFKDVARIVQGIIISKVFYSGLNAIRRVTSEVWEFSKSLEYSKMVYANMFADAGLSNEFVTVLQDFAAKTRFSFQELNEASQQLVAYGFEANNLMYVLNGVAAAASISGDPQKMESISRALGQISTKGRLMGEELRQLAEAGIPAYEILQEKLGLSYEQMRNLGKEAIPANKAINALIDGINERFGGLLEQTNTTLTGMVSNVKDIALQIASDVFSPVYAALKRFVGKFAEGLSDLYSIYKTTGLGGIFEELIPKDLQDPIRTFIANLIGFIGNMRSILSSLFSILKNAMPTIITILNMVGSAIGLLAGLLNAITSNSRSLSIFTRTLLIGAAALLAFKVAALAATVSGILVKVFDAISKAAGGLSRALMTLAQHPFLLIAVILVGSLLVMTGAFDKVRNSVDRLLKSASGAGKTSLLQPTKMEDSSASIGKFSDKLNEAKNSIGDLGKKAKKTSKDLLDFDEVFSVSPDEGTDEGILDEWDEFISQIKGGDFNPADLLKDIKVSDFASPFVDSLVTEFSEALKGFTSKITDAVAGAGIPAAFAAAIAGLAFGNPWVALAAGLATFFWDDLKQAIIDASPNPTEWAPDIEAAMDNLGSGLLASLVLKALKFPLEIAVAPTIIFGAFSLADALTAWLEDTLGMSKSDKTDKMTYKLFGMEVVFGTLTFSWPKVDLSGFFGEKGVLGEAAGLGIDGFIGYIALWLMQKLDDWTDGIAKDPEAPKWGKRIISAIGESIAGAVSGGVVGSFAGPAGTVAGFIIGAIVGAMPGAFDTSWQEMWNALTEGFASVFDWAFSDELKEAIGKCFKDAFKWDPESSLAENAVDFGSNIVKGILLAFSNPKLDVLIGAAFKVFLGLFSDTFEWDPESSFAANMATFGLDIVKGIIEGMANSTLGQLLRAAFKGFLGILIDNAATIFQIHSPSKHPEIVGIGDNIILGIIDGMVEGFGTLLTKVGSWKDDLVAKFSEWKDSVVDKATEFKDGFGEKIDLFAANTKESIENWWNGAGGVKEKFSTFKDKTLETVDKWSTGKAGMKDKFNAFKTNTSKTIETWWNGAGGVKEKFNTFKDKTLETVDKWSTGKDGIRDKFAAWTSGTKSTTENWWSGKDGIKDKFATWTSDTLSKVKSWWSGSGGLKEKFEEWSSGTHTTVSSWATDVENNFDTFTTNTLSTIGTWATNVAEKVSESLASAWSAVKSLKDSAASAVSRAKEKVSDAWEAVGEFFTGTSGEPTVPKGISSPISRMGHAAGGVFDREHIAKFAEGNKAEAIVPLENKSAMQPFVDAVSDGVYRSLAPAFATLGGNGGGNNQVPIMYVGTLIADDRGLKELNRKLNVIQVSEKTRKGLK